MRLLLGLLAFPLVACDVRVLDAKLTMALYPELDERIVRQSIAIRAYFDTSDRLIVIFRDAETQTPFTEMDVTLQIPS